MVVRETVETRLATIVRWSNGLVETRFKENVLIDEEGILENILTRRKLCADEPHALLTVIPADVHFTTTVMSPDLFPDEEERARIKAIALVAPDGIPGMMARLYFSCFPEIVRTKIFKDEELAMLWLRPHLTSSEN